MDEILFIVCNNGFGHVKRVALIVEELLVVKNISIRVITGFRQSNFLKRMLKANLQSYSGRLSLQTSGFTGVPTPNVDYSRSDDWENNLKSYLQSYTGTIISDNYVSPLGYRNCILMGSFLWLEIFIKSSNPVYRRKAEFELSLLKKNKPFMICVGDIAMPYVVKYTKPISLGWFGAPSKFRINGYLKRSGILFTAGGGETDRLAIKKIAYIVRQNHVKTVFLDDLLYDSLEGSDQNKFQRFDFTDVAFCQIRVVVCRPGVGIISDCIKYGVPCIALANIDEPEMLHNAIRIQELGIGYSLDCIEPDLGIVDNLYNDWNVWNKMSDTLLGLNLRGEKDAAIWIRNYDGKH